MAALLEIKYYNSFWLKKMRTMQGVEPWPNATNTSPVPTLAAAAVGTNILKTGSLIVNTLGAGQSLSYYIGSLLKQNIITGYYLDAPNSAVYISLLNNLDTNVPIGTDIQFERIKDFNFLPGRYSNQFSTDGEDWYIEEARIRGGYNNTSVDFGVKAYIVEENNQREYLLNTMIYSGVFNSRTGINNTNQFSVAEDITRTVDPANGSIQKLYAEDTNLTIFQELKVSRALIDKSAVYAADGTPMTTSGIDVIGQIQTYAGNYGIGKHPESFAVYGYRKYFVDTYQNAVLRLSQDGITEISSYGMFDYFRDKLSDSNLENGYVYGMWDIHTKQYVISIQPSIVAIPVEQQSLKQGQSLSSVTLTFDEDSTGWTSRHSYIPNDGVSLRSSFYTFKDGRIFKHYSRNVPLASYYGVNYPGLVTVVFNPEVSEQKSFLTVNYEGTSNWKLSNFYTETDTAAIVNPYYSASTLSGLQDQLFENRFKKKENKFFANILNISQPSTNEIYWGQSMSGLKGFFATATFSVPAGINIKSELFAVSAEYIQSSY
jgi:hypothetical protein